MKINPHTTLKCVADFVGAKKMVGDPNFVISGLNEIHEVEPGDITFVDHPKYYSKALNSQATTIIINTDEVLCPEGKALIVHDNPLDGRLTQHWNRRARRCRRGLCNRNIFTSNAPNHVYWNTFLQVAIQEENHIYNICNLGIYHIHSYTKQKFSYSSLYSYSIVNINQF